jgi:hypothetical protein
MMRISRRKFTTAVASMTMLASAGCAGFSAKPGDKRSLMDRMPWAGDKEAAPEPYPDPVKIAATWTPDTLVQTGRTPTRGFGGRVFFYDEKSRAVPVAGTLIVHGFNDKAATPQEAVKRFEFTPEQLTKHFGQTDFGASYSIWIPWDAIGGPQKRITLVTSFKTLEGKAVQGIPATVLLPGELPISTEADELAKFSPDYLKYKEALADNTPPTSGLTTTTIKRTRRRYSGTTQPGAPEPSSDLMIADSSATPSAEVPSLRRRLQSPAIQPVSAVEPIKRP